MPTDPDLVVGANESQPAAVCPDPPVHETERPPGQRGFVAAASLLAIVAGCWAVVASLWLFPVLSANSDEGIYLLQAESIAAGDLHPPQLDPEVSESFRPWFGVERNDHYLLKYTPVYAATLALSIWLFGTPLVALGLTAAAATASMVAFAMSTRHQRK